MYICDLATFNRRFLAHKNVQKVDLYHICIYVSVVFIKINKMNVLNIMYGLNMTCLEYCIRKKTEILYCTRTRYDFLLQVFFIDPDTIYINLL